MTAGAARGIRLPAPPGLPVIGAVAAGSPLLAVENQRGTLPLAPELFSPRADYLLRVRGNSMSGVGILDGDLLAVHHTAEARSGQIVVARLEDEVTVAGTAAFTMSLPVAICIVALLAIVTTSYSQTIHAYPSGGGAYIVAKENLGVTPGLVAAAALLIDYVLTVAVSVAAGIAAVTSALPTLLPYREWLCLLAIYLILTANLRGMRESATVFGVPVYLFIFSAYLLIIGGFVKIYVSGAQAAPTQAAEPGTLVKIGATWLFLRAFAAGCTALTGVEAGSRTAALLPHF